MNWGRVFREHTDPQLKDGMSHFPLWFGVAIEVLANEMLSRSVMCDFQKVL